MNNSEFDLFVIETDRRNGSDRRVSPETVAFRGVLINLVMFALGIAIAWLAMTRSN